MEWKIVTVAKGAKNKQRRLNNYFEETAGFCWRERGYWKVFYQIIHLWELAEAGQYLCM